MKKKGFTLIELLAVIVILAIIALIITPIVSDIIESSKKAAAKRSIEGYIEAANNAAAVSLIDINGINVTPDKYFFETGEDNEALSRVDINGKRPNYVYLEYDYQLLRVVLANFCYNGYAFDYDNGIIEDSTTDYCSVVFTNRPKVVVTADGELTSKVTISIDYTESTVGKQYKIGNGEYIDYTEPFEIESSRELASQRDEHGNLKICAKATIESGESTEICRSINKLDLDYPADPTIDAAGSYPTITEYGVLAGLIAINPAPSAELTPYVSFDGTNWTPYETGMSASGTTIYAKVVKKQSGLESEVTSITTTTPADALNGNAYDGNLSTYDELTGKKIYIDESMQGKTINYTYTAPSQRSKGYIFYDADNKEIEKVDLPRKDSPTLVVIEIPSNAKYMSAFEVSHVYEIEIINKSDIVADEKYPVLTEYGVLPAYTNVTINYFNTAVQKLYRIQYVNEEYGPWTNYNGNIRLELGEKIEVKSVDKYGTTSQVAEYVSAGASDALGKNAYNDDITTYSTMVNKKLYIDETMRGKKINFTYATPSQKTKGYAFYDADNKEIEKVDLPRKDSATLLVIDIPSDAKYMSAYEAANVYKIEVFNAPDIVADETYPILTSSGVTAAYTNVTINYFSTAVQKLYRIQRVNGDYTSWMNYNGNIRLELGEKIEAKSIDKNNTTSQVAEYVSAGASDALGKNAYDGDATTYAELANKKIYIDSSIKGGKVTFTYSTPSQKTKGYIFYDADNKEIERVDLPRKDSATAIEITVPNNAQYMSAYEVAHIFEIGPSN